MLFQSLGKITGSSENINNLVVQEHHLLKKRQITKTQQKQQKHLKLILSHRNLKNIN